MTLTATHYSQKTKGLAHGAMLQAPLRCTSLYGVSFYDLLPVCKLLIEYDEPGFPQSFPIFQTYLSSEPSGRYHDSFILAFLAPGLQDIEEGILFQVLPKAARYRQTIVIIGVLIMTLAIDLGSCSSTA